MKTLVRMAALFLPAAIVMGSTGRGEVVQQSFAPLDVQITIEVVDGSDDNVGTFASLALDENGLLVVIYHNATRGELLLAKKDGSWEISTIDTLRNVGQFASLAMDPSGNANASYYDATEQALKYAGWIETAWAFDIELVTPGMNSRGTHAHLILDADDRLAVAFYDETLSDLMYAVKNGSWAISTIDALRDVGQYASLAMDASGNANASYYDANEQALKYAGWIETAWAFESELVTPGMNYRGTHAHLILDADDRLAVGFYDETLGDLMYAVKNGSWAISTIDALRNVGQYASLAMDPSGNANASYYDATEQALKYAGSIVATWVADVTVVTSGPYDMGQFASADFDIHSYLNVAFYDAHEKRLMHTRRLRSPDGPSWTTPEVVDNTGDVGKYASMKIVRRQPYDESFHISYYDATNGHLKYAGDCPLDWTTVEDDADLPSLPQRFALRGCAPNPFNPTTTIFFDLPAEARVKLAVYDLSGRRVRTLIDGNMAAGRHSQQWDGTDDAGRQVASGVYLCRMISSVFADTKRMTLVK